MKFLENIKSSIYNPAYYKEILNKPFSYSFRYFLSLMGLVALIITAFFSFSTLPGMNQVVREIVPNIMKYYPDNLEVTVEKGKVSTNVQEPFFIKLPADFKDGANGLENKKIQNNSDLSQTENLLVIDTVSPLSVDTFKNYKTFILLSRENIVYYDNGAIKIQPLNQSFDGVVTKAKVSAALNEIVPYINVLPYFAVPIVFLGSFIGLIFGYLIYLIFGAFVIWLAAKIVKRELDYGKSFQVGLHAITLGVILDLTVFRFFPGFNIPFLFTFIMVVIVWVNLNFAAAPDDTSLAPKNPSI